MHYYDSSLIMISFIIKEDEGFKKIKFKSLENGYTKDDARNVIDSYIEHNALRFNTPVLYTENEREIEKEPFRKALISKIKDMLDQLEKVYGQVIYKKYMSFLTRLDNFNVTVKTFECLLEELKEL